MMGVYAEFPKLSPEPPPPITNGTLNLDSGTRRYVAYSWVSSPGAVGSTTPINLSVQPGIGSAPGAVGEILSIQYSAPDLLLYVRGPGSTSDTPGFFNSLAEVPFTNMKLNGVNYPKSSWVLTSGYILRYTASNPLLGALNLPIEFT